MKPFNIIPHGINIDFLRMKWVALAITSLLADEVVRKGDEVVVSVSLRQRGFAGQGGALHLEAP